jgi:hypothetical protein
VAPQTIDEVLTELDQIIRRARSERDPLGFFATLYRNVTISMIIKVRSDIEEVSPWIKLLDRYASQTEDRLINFSLGKARASAWLVAKMINSTPADRLTRELNILDEGVAKLGSLIGSPKWLISLGLHVIRIRESNDVPHVIDALSQM